MRDMFESWAQFADRHYVDQQWMLSKWENVEGFEWPEDKVRLMTEHIRSRLALSEGVSFADLGCGGGWILERLRTEEGFAMGLDFAFSMLTNAKIKNSTGRWVCGDICEIPLKAELFDRALCYFVLINVMDDEDIQNAIRNIARILKPGGRALIGQLPDQACSKSYDAAKSDYLDYCRSRFQEKKDLRDVCKLPQKLFDRNALENFLKQESVSFQLLDSFNPFYRTGQPETVSWRFDILMQK